MANVAVLILYASSLSAAYFLILEWRRWDWLIFGQSFIPGTRYEITLLGAL